MKLCIAVPTNRDPHPQFMACLLSLTRRLSEVGVQGLGKVEYTVAIKQNVSNLPQGRQDLLDEAILGGYTHLLFLDDDMEFPRDMLDYFVGAKVPCIAVNACRKADRLSYTALELNGREMKSKGKIGIERASKVGTGILLLELAALRGIPAPHFEMPWVPSRHRYRGEDYSLSTVLGKSGVEVWVDHEVSNHVGHIGSYAFRFDTYETVEEVRKQAIEEFKASAA